MYYRRNIQALEKRFPGIIKEIRHMECNTQQEKETIEVKSARNGSLTAQITNEVGQKFYLHSAYQPEKEAKQFAELHFADEQPIYLVYGFAFGYHIRAALEKLSSQQRLYVVDIHLPVFYEALHHMDLAETIQDERLHLIITSDEKIIAKYMQPLVSQAKFITYVPAVKLIPNRYEYFKYIMESWNMRLAKLGQHDGLLEKNYEQNKTHHHPNICKYFGTMQNKPIIIVSAGPSLNKNKHLLKDMMGKAFIFAVGSALKSLLRAGITPDMFCIIDPQDITYKQIEGYENQEIPLVYLVTASAYTVSKYQGPKFVVYNQEHQAEDKDQLIRTGGSVATAVMDMAIRFGGNPIIFVGQDLAYTNSEHHADGNMYGEEEKVKETPNMRKVKGQNGEMLTTTLGLLSFKYWIENRIADFPEILFINATEGGVYIDGCQHMTLRDVISQYTS